jgi:hypothetical protein
MASQPPAAVGQRGTKRVLVAVGIVGGLVVAALLGGWTYLKFSGHNMAGLKGTWRDTNNPRHLYEFRPNGDLETWTGSKSWWNRIGWSATWRRDGQQITIRTDRNWDFRGQLDGGAMCGKMLIRNESGAIITDTIDTTIAGEQDDIRVV